MRESSFFQQVADEAKVELERENVLEVLRLRFGETAAAEFQQAVNAIPHLEQLKALHTLAVQSRRIRWSAKPDRELWLQLLVALAQAVLQAAQ